MRGALCSGIHPPIIIEPQSGGEDGDVPIPLLTSLGWIVGTLTGYRYKTQGFVNVFSQDSLCDNGPLLNTFPITLTTFEDYLREYLTQNSGV